MTECTRFAVRWGCTPDSAEGAYSAPAGPLAVFKGPTSNGSSVLSRHFLGGKIPPPRVENSPPRKIPIGY